MEDELLKMPGENRKYFVKLKEREKLRLKSNGVNTQRRNQVAN